ncbi:MAG: Sir2 family NAD-dependent protein deacetylase [Bacteroidota bacterium]|nr:Sir2 family NAD-dependent protein deacetylase [Bacteroidota bacterium]
MTIASLKEQINHSSDIVFFTGAGISTESGIPDFRSPNGVWQKYKPVMFQEFCMDPKARERYWQMKYENYLNTKGVKPNSGHNYISQIEKEGKLLGLITQNVDGLHQLSSIPKEKYIEIHGTEKTIACLDCNYKVRADSFFKKATGKFNSPRCPNKSCQGLLKPATISFGQNLNQNALDKAYQMIKEADLFITMGSSLVVYPAARFPEVAAKLGIPVVIINRESTT